MNKKYMVMSDVHLPNWRLDDRKFARFLAHKINEDYPTVTHIFFTGDLTNSIRRTNRILKYMNGHLENAVAYYIIGNHEEYIHDEEEVETYENEYYINNRWIETDDTVFIGWNGWYNYSFSPTEISNEQTFSIKKGTWSDYKYVEQSMSDQDKYNKRVDELWATINSIPPEVIASKQVVLLTHFVPHKDFLVYDEPTYRLTNAFMGSDLYLDDRVNTVIFGHNHKNKEKVIDGIHFINLGLGYPGENTDGDFIENVIKYAKFF